MAPMTDAEKLKFILEQEEARRKTLTTEEQIEIVLGRSGAAAAKLKQQLFEQEKILKDSVEKYNQIIDAQNRLPEIQQQILDTESKIDDYLNNKITLSQEEVDQLSKQYEQLIKIRDLAKEDADDAKQKIVEAEKTNKQLTKQKETMDEQKSISDSLVNSAKDLFNQYFSLSGVINIISNQTKEILQANEQFAKSTGQIADNFVQFGDLSGMGQYGVTAGDLIETNGDLINSFSSFTNLSKNVQGQLSSTAAKMDVLGISASETGQIFNILTKSLGVSADMADDAMQTMAKTAIGIGVAPQKMAKDFSSAMTSLAANGKKAQDVFFALAKQSKALGVEVSTLLSVAEGFDTFESAAEKTGKLNSILGGNYLNSLELVMANEEERIRMIKQGFDLSGRQFQDLDRATQKSIALSLGFKNAAEASAILGTSTSEMTAEMEKAEASQKAMDEAMTTAASITKQLQTLFNTLAPVLNKIAIFIKDLVIGFSKFNDALGGAPVIIIAVIAIMGALGSVAIMVAGAFASAMTSIIGFGSAAPAAGASITTTIVSMVTALTTSFVAIGNALANPKVMLGLIILSVTMLSLAVAIAAIGVAAVGIGYGMKLAAEGVVMIVNAFKELGAAAVPAAFAVGIFVIAFAAMMLGLMAMASNPLSWVAVALVLAVGAAALMIGGGIYLAASGISKFVESIKGLLDKRTETKDTLKIIGDGAISLVKAFNELKDTTIVKDIKEIQGSFAHMQNEILISQQNLASFISTASTGTTPISAINDALTTMDTVMSKLSNTMWNLMWNVMKLGDAIKQFPVLDTFVVSAVVRYLTDSLVLPEEGKNIAPAMESIGRTVTQVSTITKEQLEPTIKFVELVKEIKTTKENDLDKVGKLLEKLINASKPSEQGMKPNINVQVFLDSQEIAAKVQWGDELVSSLVGGGPTFNVTPASKGKTK